MSSSSSSSSSSRSSSGGGGYAERESAASSSLKRKRGRATFGSAGGGSSINAAKKAKRKKGVSFRGEDELEQVKLFGLDEVVKAVAKEVSAAAASRMLKSCLKDTMFIKMDWVTPFYIHVQDMPARLALAGRDSKEKGVQRERERTTSKAVYISDKQIPDDPAEPDEDDTVDPNFNFVKEVPLGDVPDGHVHAAVEKLSSLLNPDVLQKLSKFASLNTSYDKSHYTPHGHFHYGMPGAHNNNAPHYMGQQHPHQHPHQHQQQQRIGNGAPIHSSSSHFHSSSSSSSSSGGLFSQPVRLSGGQPSYLKKYSNDPNKVKTRHCVFFNSRPGQPNRGCAKGDMCSFIHDPNHVGSGRVIPYGGGGMGQPRMQYGQQQRPNMPFLGSPRQQQPPPHHQQQSAQGGQGRNNRFMHTSTASTQNNEQFQQKRRSRFSTNDNK
jgi:hypothetical protein